MTAPTEFGTFLTWRTARKEYKCAACVWRIQKGERYARVRVLREGHKPELHRVCWRCGSRAR